MSKKYTQKRAGALTVEPLEVRRLFSVAYGSNLILNPGAEAYSGSADGFNIITPNHWTASGNPTVVQYRSGYGSSILVRKPDNAGNAFFAGGPDDETDDLFQSIDLSSIATAVDAGQVSFKLGALIGGRATDGDNATVSVNFRDVSETALAEFGTASVSAGDRDNRTKFIGRTRTGTVPADARFAQIQIHFKRDDGSYNDGFADNLSLVLTTNTPSTVGITPTVVKSSFKPTVISGQKINASMVLNLANTSSSINKGLDTISLFASSNGVVDSSSVAIATTNRVLNLGAGKSARLDPMVKTLSLPVGNYTIFAQTKDSFGTVVTTAGGPTVSVVAPMIMLTGSLNPPTYKTSGGNLIATFTFLVSNTGNVDSTGVATISAGIVGAGSEIQIQTHSIKKVTVKAGGRPVAFRLRVIQVGATAASALAPVAVFSQDGDTVTASL